MAETYLYRHIWPIVDQDVPMSALTAEASRELGPLLGQLGARPTARPRWVVVEDRLVCEVPVLRLDGEPESAPDGEGVDPEAVLALVREGKPDGHIAAVLGYPRSAVERIREEGWREPAGEPAVVVG